MATDLPKRLTIPRVADELGVTRKHVYTLLQARLLDAIVVSVSGQSTRYSLRVSGESVTRFIHERKYSPGDNL